MALNLSYDIRSIEKNMSIVSLMMVAKVSEMLEDTHREYMQWEQEKANEFPWGKNSWGV